MRLNNNLRTIGANQLPFLLHQKESATLEFKREWYKLSGNGDIGKRQKDELIKDILALANGNAYSAGEPGVLIVGVDSDLSEDGLRNIYEVGKDVPQTSSILDMVRAASSPPLEDLEVIPFETRGKCLFAIVIPPSPHLYETTRRLDATKSYSEFVVFMRSNENIKIASAKEREVIKRQKEISFSEMRNAPPILLGTSVGAVVGGLLLGSVGEKVTGNKNGTVSGMIVGSFMGGVLGGLTGNTYKITRNIKSSWFRVPVWGRVLSIVVGGITAIVTWMAQKRLSNWLGLAQKNSKTSE